MHDESLVRFRRVVAAGYAELERRRQEINDLNVFPVADGDTGDNMAMTMRAVLDELDRLDDERTLDEIGRREIVDAVARAALLGARGNSGVILSQIVRGAAEELASRPGELVDPVLVSAAFARAADAAYDSVRDPAEGTMLTAVRAMASRLVHDLAHTEVPRLGPDAAPAEQDSLLADQLSRAFEAVKDAVDRGPEQLAVLREAGVVDAGAYGLAVIVAGVLSSLRGEDEPQLEHQPPPRIPLDEHPHESGRYRYCTNFVVTGSGLHGSSFVPELERLGDSVLVVGEDKTLRVHVHTDEPELAAAIFEGVGTVMRFEHADMHEQVASRVARLGGTATGPQVRCAVVAVASGAGIRRLYEELGAVVVSGGETTNPSTSELLEGIRLAPGEEVLVLPNDPNVRMAADAAAELATKTVRVVPTRAPQEGLAALVAYDSERSAEDNAAAVERAAAGLSTGGVARAARADAEGRFAIGDAVGYADDELVAWGDPAQTLTATIARIAEGRELVTCLAGDGAPLDADELRAAVPDGVELEYLVGAQPAWWWLLSAE